ncbi:hypothetical protein [Elongatibacter sediminis]|uniref:Uncharacterized protein n=1 Tax=Elongatibacter sediminis TaxID=3119006 RepID=A0AAW9RJ49_9GAMM
MNGKYTRKGRSINRTCSLLAALALGPFSALPAVADNAVFVTGYSISSDDPPEFPVTDDQLAMFGHAADIGLSMAMHKLGIDPGTDEYNDIVDAVDEFLNNVRPQDRQVERGSFSAVYQSCVMIFSSPPQVMSIRMPPGSAQAYMEGYDFASMEGFSVELNRDLSATRQAVGQGWSGGLQMTPTGATDTMLGYEAREYTFSSDGGLGNLGQAATSPEQAAGPGGLASMVSVSTNGRAWVSDEVEGLDIIQSFYENFASQIAASQGENSFYGGLMKNMVGQLQHGLPLHTYQRTESKVMGRTMQGGESESWVTSVSTYDRDQDECGTSILPGEDEGYEITYMGANGMPGSAGTGSGAGGNTGAGSPGAPGGNSQGGQLPQACDCSCEAFKRLQEQGEDAANAENQGQAMCMMQCMQQFMACAMQGR